MCNKQTVDPGIALRMAVQACKRSCPACVKQHVCWHCVFASALWMQSKTDSEAYLAVRFILFMSPSSSRNFSSSSRIVSTLVFNRTMRFLIRRILSSNNVVTCKHICMSVIQHTKAQRSTLTKDKCLRCFNILAAPCSAVTFAPN